MTSTRPIGNKENSHPATVEIGSSDPSLRKSRGVRQGLGVGGAY